LVGAPLGVPDAGCAIWPRSSSKKSKLSPAAGFGSPAAMGGAWGAVVDSGAVGVSGAATGAGGGGGAWANRSSTRSTRAWASKGLATCPAAPQRCARSSSKASKVPVSSSTGMCLSDGSLLMASHTS
jgi:hypothetical protein